MVLYKKIIALVLFAVIVFPVTGVSAASTDCFSTEWPHERSDLKADPGIVFGRLENGFRYVLKKNSEPRDRVAMSLDIQAGSLQERDEQRGIAHFLEHMLFNGSTHFKPGELVEYFQSIGMSFGGDTNAHTGYDETVYDIILPEGTVENIEKGLLVFSDYARGALLLQSEIDRERGVILSEKRSRDSAGYRAHVKETEFSMKGTLIPDRMPIGTVETLNRADHALMKDFYDAWYRPENMILVMVGDFDPQRVEPLIKKRFVQLTASGEKPDCPDIGLLQQRETEFFYHHDAEMGITEVSVETLWNVEPQDDSLAFEQKELTAYVANKILQYRLDELARKSGTPFTSATVYSGIFLGRIRYSEIGAKCDPDKWRQSLVLIENSLRQALGFGFTETEFQRVKKELIAELDQAVLTAGSRNSKALAASLIRAINSNRVPQSPQQERDLFAPVLEKMSLADVNKRFRELWAQQSRLVKVTGNAVIADEEALEAIESVYRSAAAEKLLAYEEEKEVDFPYLQLSGENKVVSREVFPEIDASRVVFDSGLIVNLKKTGFEENEIKVAVDFGTGKAGEPVPGLALLAEAVVGQSGTGILSKNDLDRILSGSSVEVGFRVNPASFSWQGKALTKDAELLFQVLQSLLADPGVDADAYTVSMDRFRQLYEGMSKDVRGAMKLHGDSFLAGGNPFFGLPPQSDFMKLQIDQLRSWYLPAAEKSALEISLVGDFDEEEVLQLLKKYMAVLSPRVPTPVETGEVSFPEGRSLALKVSSSIDKGMLVLAWKTDDFWDIHRTRGLHLVAEIFSDKLRRLVREKLGATYSPQVYNQSSRTYKGYGVLQAILIVDPTQLETLKAEVLNLAGEMWQGKITEEELLRAKGPMLTSLKDMVRSNGYWLGSVLSLSSRYPQQLQWPQSILDAFENYSLDEIKYLARTYLAPGREAVITVAPE